jgi:cytochrome oxidase Cu insertion factor (SCO1/SenC/PrrC family)
LPDHHGRNVCGDAKAGAQSDQVQVLFVTLDPQRDTQALLSAYVPAFDSRFLGLYGDAAEIDKLAKGLKVFYQKVRGKRLTVTLWITQQAAMFLISKGVSAYSCVMHRDRNQSCRIYRLC